MLLSAAQVCNATELKQAEMFRRICAALDSAGVRWCITCGYANYPRLARHHDVDMLVERGRFKEIPRILASLEDVHIAQAILHESTAARYEMVAYTEEGETALLPLHVCSDVRYPGAVFLEADEFLAQRQRVRDLFWIPPPGVEFGYYLIKKLEKSSRLGIEEFSEVHAQQLDKLYRQNPCGCAEQLQRLLSGPDARQLREHIIAGDWKPIRRNAPVLYRAMLRKRMWGHPISALRYWSADLWRRAKRIARPTGLTVALTGCEPERHSSIVAEIEQSLTPKVFRSAVRLESGGPGLVRYIAGVLPQLVLSRLVTWNGPSKRFAPGPHLLIEFDDDGEVEELAGQVKRRILDFMCKRTAQRLGIEGRQTGMPAPPRGLMVVFLGPDGAGKSTVMQRVQEDLGKSFTGTKRFHLRPTLLKGKAGNGQVRQPHAKPPRGLAASLAKLLWWWADYVGGYLLLVRPRLKRGELICFDRYCHDLLVDQRRYRYGGPMILARLLARVVPQPDLFILLEAPPQIIHARKQDISAEEADRQSQEYRNLIADRADGRILDASQPLEQVVKEAKEHIRRSVKRN